MVKLQALLVQIIYLERACCTIFVPGNISLGQTKALRPQIPHQSQNPPVWGLVSTVSVFVTQDYFTTNTIFSQSAYLELLRTIPHFKGRNFIKRYEMKTLLHFSPRTRNYSQGCTQVVSTIQHLKYNFSTVQLLKTIYLNNTKIEHGHQ